MLSASSFTIWAATWQNQQSDCAPSEDSDQPGHQSSLIKVFAVRMKKPWVLSYPLSAQRRLWSDWADAQADLRLRWAHTFFVGFVMSRLISFKYAHNFQHMKAFIERLIITRLSFWAPYFVRKWEVITPFLWIFPSEIVWRLRTFASWSVMQL